MSDTYSSLLSERLGSQAPPVIFGVGNDALLAKPGIGIVGSRDVDADGARVAEQFAEEAVRLGFHVTSGAARGVDQLAMNAAYRADGSVVGVLADSLQQRIRSTRCHVGPRRRHHLPDQPATPRSRLLCWCGDGSQQADLRPLAVTVVVACDLDTGGTWAGATEAMHHRYGAVAVWRGDGEGPGNARLADLGAKPLGKIGDLQSALVAEDPEPVQMSLIE